MKSAPSKLSPPVFATALAAILAACGPHRDADAAARPAEARVNGLTAAQSREVLARIGDETITLGEFGERLAAQSPYLRARFNSPERRREMLDNMIRFELLVQEARRRGLDHDPAVERLETQALVDELLRVEIDAHVSLQSVTEQEVRAYYDAHPDEWNQPEQVRASHLRFADRAAAQRALASILAAPTDAELFRRLAREQSNDTETRTSGGDLRFFSRPGTGPASPDAPPDAVANAAFALTEIGSVTPTLVQADDGFHVVKLTARRQPMHRTFDEVKRIIQDRLYRERREAMITALVARLRTEEHVQEDADALATVRIPAPPPTDADEHSEESP